MSSEAERAQASVELVAGAAALMLAAAVTFQLLAAGYAVVMADHAAEAGALALANGDPPAPGALSALPGWPARAARVEVEAGAVRVTLTPPSPLGFLRDRLAVTGRAAARAPRRAPVSWAH
jgi:hypothetical protein